MYTFTLSYSFELYYISWFCVSLLNVVKLSQKLNKEEKKKHSCCCPTITKVRLSFGITRYCIDPRT